MPTAGGPADQYIQISDFTPGILATRSGGVGPTPNRPDEEAQSAYARESGTFGCYGHPAGGLHPLPHIEARFRMPMSQGDLFAVSTAHPYSSGGGLFYEEGNDPTEIAYTYEDVEYIVATHITTNVEGSVTADLVYPWGGLPLDASVPAKSVPEPNPDILSFSTHRSALRNIVNVSGASTYTMYEYRTYIRWRQLQLTTQPMVNTGTWGPPSSARAMLYHIISQKQDANFLLKQYSSGAIGLSGPVVWPKIAPAGFTTMTSGTYWDSDTATRLGEQVTLGALTFNMPGRLPGYMGVIWQSATQSFKWGATPNVPTSHPTGVPVVAFPSFFYNFPSETVMRGWKACVVPGTGATSGNAGNSTLYTGYIVLTHQNRYVVCGYRTYDQPGSADPGTSLAFGWRNAIQTSDGWRYSPVNHLTGEEATAHSDRRFWPMSPPTRFGAPATGFGAAASMNASELFLIRDTGGGAIVRGDLESPQVTDYPGIPSTNGAANIPAVTPLGMVYGTRDGVYAWAGADQMQKLSNQIEGWFWRPSDNSTRSNMPGVSHGKFGYSPPFIYAPNNWVLDTRSGGWFRLTDPTDPTSAVYKDYNVSATGKVYASPGQYSPATSRLVADRFNPELLAHKWRWVSQTLPVASSKIVRFSELVVVASGVGVLTFTLKGLDNTTQTVTIPINSTEPVELSARLNIETHDAYITISAVGDETGPAPTIPGGDPNEPYLLPPPYQTPAPILYRVSLGVNKQRSVKQVN